MPGVPKYDCPGVFTLEMSPVCAPKDVLSATIAAQVIALERGANILRVHDVAAAKQAIQIVQLTHKN